jgi:hypothetical protein
MAGALETNGRMHVEFEVTRFPYKGASPCPPELTRVGRRFKARKGSMILYYSEGRSRSRIVQGTATSNRDSGAKATAWPGLAPPSPNALRTGNPVCLNGIHPYAILERACACVSIHSSVYFVEK